MSHFTLGELAYLAGQRLGRLATLDAGGAPNVVPVGFRYNAERDTIDIGGRALGKTKKFRNAGSDGRVAFVVDDVLPPWQPRGIEVRGRAEVHKTGGEHLGPGFGPELMSIVPTQIISWGVESDAFQPHSREVASG